MDSVLDFFWNKIKTLNPNKNPSNLPQSALLPDRSSKNRMKGKEKGAEREKNDKVPLISLVCSPFSHISKKENEMERKRRKKITFLLILIFCFVFFSIFYNFLLFFSIHGSLNQLGGLKHNAQKSQSCWEADFSSIFSSSRSLNRVGRPNKKA